MSKVEIDKDQAAFPLSVMGHRPEFGLTKREYFAALAMQGLASATVSYGETVETQAKTAIEMADALIKELNS